MDARFGKPAATLLHAESGGAAHATNKPGSADFLARLSGPDRAALLDIAREEEAMKHQVLFRAGEPSTRVFVLRSGLVKISEVSDIGREAILWFCLSGEIFGLSEAVAGGTRGVNATACERCALLSIDSNEFRSFLSQHPEAALLSLQALSARLRGLGQMLVNFVSDDVHTRVGKLLLRLSARYGQRVGSEIVLQIPLTHQEISDMVGAARPTVSSVLSDLKRKGVLRIDNHRIRIESKDLLQEFGQN